MNCSLRQVHDARSWAYANGQSHVFAPLAWGVVVGKDVVARFATLTEARRYARATGLTVIAQD